MSIAGATPAACFDRERGNQLRHSLGNLLAVVLSLVSLLLRRGDHAGAILPGGLILSFIVVGILLVTGWVGGELAYRFKIGVIEDAAERPAKTSGIDYAYAGDRPEKRPEP